MNVFNKDLERFVAKLLLGNKSEGYSIIFYKSFYMIFITKYY